MHNPAVHLEDFMERVGVDDAGVAEAVRRDRSTISRIRRQKVRPDGETLLRINAWATDVASKKRLLVRERLSWDHLLDDAAA